MAEPPFGTARIEAARTGSVVTGTVLRITRLSSMMGVPLPLLGSRTVLDGRYRRRQRDRVKRRRHA